MLTTPRDRIFTATAFVILVGDIITKRLAESRLPLHIPQEIVGDWVRFTLTYNKGAAMNMSLGASSRIVFSVLAVVMVAIIIRMWRGLPANAAWLSCALGSIAAGATGNLLDRLRGTIGVVDFIDVGVGATRFWTFNVADSGVTVGAIVLAILTWKEPKERPAGGDAPPPA